jgi:5-methylcytosine-specific restriction endonuclease McrA
MRDERFKERRRKRKRQFRINANLKKRLCKDIVLAPCCYCKRVFLIDELTIEHLVPLSLGGTNNTDNIALACAPCNHKRGREAWLLSRKSNEQYSSQH